MTVAFTDVKELSLIMVPLALLHDVQMGRHQTIAHFFHQAGQEVVHTFVNEEENLCILDAQRIMSSVVFGRVLL